MKTPLTPIERQAMDRLFFDVRMRVSGPVSSLAGLDLLWDDRYNTENGILGSFWWGRPNEICLSPVGKTTPELLLGVLFHELHHRWQWQTYGVGYILALAPGVRQWLLEPSAYMIEAEVDALLERDGAR